MRSRLLSEILELEVAERIKVAEAIWESIQEIPEALALTEAQRQALDRRLEAYLEDPKAGSPWEAVRARILSRSSHQS